MDRLVRKIIGPSNDKYLETCPQNDDIILFIHGDGTGSLDNTLLWLSNTH